MKAIDLGHVKTASLGNDKDLGKKIKEAKESYQKRKNEKRVKEDGAGETPRQIRDKYNSERK